MRKYLALMGLVALGSAQAQDFRNVASINVPLISISSAEGNTYLFINSFAFAEYDRSVTSLISIFGKGTLAVSSGGNGTSTILGIGGGLRFWFSRNFSGLYLGPAGGLLIVPSRTYFVIGGEVGYRFLLSDRFSLSIGGGPDIKVGSGPSILSVAGYISVGYPF